MIIYAKSIQLIGPSWHGGAALELDIEMTEAQMHAAVLQFLTRIDGATWGAWVRGIDQMDGAATGGADN
jgi:hypothetical protein